jgi:hypothetical protein
MNHREVNATSLEQRRFAVFPTRTITLPRISNDATITVIGAASARSNITGIIFYKIPHLCYVFSDSRQSL